MKLCNYGIFFSVLLLGIGLVLCVIFNPNIGIKSESAIIPLIANRNLVSQIYLPKNTLTPYPVMVLCHGVNNSKEVMKPLAVELARHGIAAITFDFGGYGESYPLPRQDRSVTALEASTLADAEAVLSFVRRYPQRFDLSRMGIMGHSMGGNTALQLAQKVPQLRSTVLLSMAGLANSASPSNLFLGVGLYEQINSPQELRVMLQQATDRDHPECLNTHKICGDFKTGTARKLVISPTSDHIIAPYDPQLIQQILDWVQQSLDIPLQEKPLTAPWLIVGLLTTFGGGIASGVSIFLRTSQPLTKPNLRLAWVYCVTWLMGFLIAFIIIMAASGLTVAKNASNTLIFCYILQLCSNYALLSPQKIAPALRVAALYSILFLTAFILPALICAIPELWQKPEAIIHFPEFFLQWCVFAIYNYIQPLKLALFPGYTFYLQPSWLFGLLVLLECLLPGIALQTVEKMATKGLAWLRRPFRFSGIGTISRKQAAIIGGLVLVLAGVLYQRLSDGLIQVAASQGGVALRMLGLFLGVPLFVIITGVRSPWFYRLEGWLIQKN